MTDAVRVTRVSVQLNEAILQRLMQQSILFYRLESVTQRGLWLFRNNSGHAFDCQD